MKLYATTIQAIDPEDGQLKHWCGPNVPGLTRHMAERHCQANGLGYCSILGELIAEIPAKATG